MNATGFWIVAGVLVLALAFGLYRRHTDGRVRAVGSDGRRGAGSVSLDARVLGAPLGAGATFLQFSSPACAPCAATRRHLSEITAEDPGLAHIEIDSGERLDLVRRLGVTRTPTVFLLDAAGVVRHRVTGAARRAELLEAALAVAPRRTT